jgi:RNA polymerase sigma-70 factor (subfamily 1)
MPPDARPLESFRDYLLVLARARLDPRLCARLDPADVVQRTLIEACRDLPAVQGKTREELSACLRRLLANNLLNALREISEPSLDDALARSAAGLGAWLADEQKNNLADFDRLAHALAELPADQREVIELRFFHALSIEALASHVGISAASVAGLLHRGLATLRPKLHREP